MKIHYLQHVAFEGLGSMEAVLKEKGHSLFCSRLYLQDELPPVDTFDWLIVMGGPMGAEDDLLYPWLKPEQELIRETIHAGKPVLGICLGAQLIAKALGARVYKNKHREIGWFEIKMTKAAAKTILAPVFPAKTTVFHWHGDTFDIPEGAVPIAESRACKNQGFVLNDRVIAFQFHLETTAGSLKNLVDNCADELDGTEYVQTSEEMFAEPQRFETVNAIMEKTLNAVESMFPAE